jgi:hypothetical protein
MQITRQRQRFSSRVVKFASQVLYSMWVHQELREVYRKAGWKEQGRRNDAPNMDTELRKDYLFEKKLGKSFFHAFFFEC